MATEFQMPAPATQYTQSPSHYTLYGTQSQPISPISSATATPRNGSPTSPRSAVSHLSVHSQQLRPPKSPLYVPAVLRPTEPPVRRVAKPSPLTPPQSMNSSFDSLQNVKPLSRRSTGDSGKFGLGKITENEWAVQGLPKVTDTPTRSHWKPDSEAAICDEATCTRTFSYFTRRHHCRRCGNIFCDLHSLYAIPLDQDANYHPYGTRSRACEHCFSEYKGWEIARSSRSNSESSNDNTEIPTTPSVNCESGRSKFGSMFGPKNNGLGVPESMGASVPRDWNWSTF